MFGLNKIIINKKQAVFTFSFFTFIFLIGLISGTFVPDESYEKIREYAILLEKENSRINKVLKSCNFK